jgi:hypothetical protein
MRDTHVCGVCERIKQIPLRDASDDVEIPFFQYLIHVHMKENWGHDFGGWELEYIHDVGIEIILKSIHNAQMYYCTPFHSRTSVNLQGLHCEREYSNANQGLIPVPHAI